MAIAGDTVPGCESSWLWQETLFLAVDVYLSAFCNKYWMFMFCVCNSGRQLNSGR